MPTQSTLPSPYGCAAIAAPSSSRPTADVARVVAEGFALPATTQGSRGSAAQVRPGTVRTLRRPGASARRRRAPQGARGWHQGDAGRQGRVAGVGRGEVDEQRSGVEHREQGPWSLRRPGWARTAGRAGSPASRPARRRRRRAWLPGFERQVDRGRRRRRRSGRNGPGGRARSRTFRGPGRQRWSGSPDRRSRGGRAGGRRRRRPSPSGRGPGRCGGTGTPSAASPSTSRMRALSSATRTTARSSCRCRARASLASDSTETVKGVEPTSTSGTRNVAVGLDRSSGHADRLPQSARPPGRLSVTSTPVSGSRPSSLIEAETCDHVPLVDAFGSLDRRRPRCRAAESVEPTSTG